MKWPWAIKKPAHNQGERNSLDARIWMCDQWYHWRVQRVWIGSGRSRRAAYHFQVTPFKYPFSGYCRSVVTFPSGIDKTIRAIYTGISRTYDANNALEDLDR